MTALEAHELGVEVVVRGTSLRLRAPESAADVVAIVRAEVARRVGEGAMTVLARVTSRVGECVTCGDRMSPHKGGMCTFCLAASIKINEARR